MTLRGAEGAAYKLDSYVGYADRLQTDTPSRREFSELIVTGPDGSTLEYSFVAGRGFLSPIGKTRLYFRWGLFSTGFLLAALLLYTYSPSSVPFIFAMAIFPSFRNTPSPFGTFEWVEFFKLIDWTDVSIQRFVKSVTEALHVAPHQRNGHSEKQISENLHKRLRKHIHKMLPAIPFQYKYLTSNKSKLQQRGFPLFEKILNKGWVTFDPSWELAASVIRHMGRANGLTNPEPLPIQDLPDNNSISLRKDEYQKIFTEFKKAFPKSKLDYSRVHTTLEATKELPTKNFIETAGVFTDLDGQLHLFIHMNTLKRFESKTLHFAGKNQSKEFYFRYALAMTFVFAHMIENEISYKELKKEGFVIDHASTLALTIPEIFKKAKKIIRKSKTSNGPAFGPMIIGLTVISWLHNRYFQKNLDLPEAVSLGLKSFPDGRPGHSDHRSQKPFEPLPPIRNGNQIDKKIKAARAASRSA